MKSARKKPTMKQTAASSKKFLGLGVIALAAATMALTGCGGGGGGGGAIAALPTTPQTPTSPQSPADPITPNTPTEPTAGGDASLVSSVAAATYSASSEEFAAFDLLNQERARCGFGKLAQNAQLDVAAQGHANYLVKNNYTGHFQASGVPDYTGNGPADRATAAGYNWAVIMDDNSSVTGAGANTLAGKGAAGIRSLLSAPYHALSLLSPELDVGISVVSSDTVGTTGTYGPRTVTQLNIGVQQGQFSQKPDSATVQTYPCNGTAGTAYQLKNESPNPIPGRDLAVNPIGQPVMVAVRPGQALTITSATMVKKSDGSAVTLRPALTKLNDTNGSIANGYAVIMPDAPLLPNTEYTVTIAGTNTTTTGMDGNGNLISTGTNPAIKDNTTGDFSKTFSFTTGS
ncbi:CAP domain-containing protein [Variovorax saccharolyticus]|uniref:CAP domain-containing protein n=1 Tax=Variovorax saccharolyticus TaxID=3053516 RepID=UPI0025787AEF|nr:CAP domain-containing protein [Variovorax sp. J31P216]MDM0028406.1 CAP domain-containing protein [Variovorax sp. J31P216]